MTEYEDMDRIHVAQDTGQYLAPVNTVVNLRFP